MYFSQCNGMVYTIQPGDTVYAISRKFRVPVWAILRANSGVDVYNLRIGAKLCIPAACNCGNGMNSPVLRPQPRDEWEDFD